MRTASALRGGGTGGQDRAGWIVYWAAAAALLHYLRFCPTSEPFRGVPAMRGGESYCRARSRSRCCPGHQVPAYLTRAGGVQVTLCFSRVPYNLYGAVEPEIQHHNPLRCNRQIFYIAIPSKYYSREHIARMDIRLDFSLNTYYREKSWYCFDGSAQTLASSAALYYWPFVYSFIIYISSSST